MRRKVLSVLLAALMIVAVLPAGAKEVEAAGNGAKEKIETYINFLRAEEAKSPTGYVYWNGNKRDNGVTLKTAINNYNQTGNTDSLKVGLTYNPCVVSGSHLHEYGCTSNTFASRAQCQGFAWYFVYYLFGSYPGDGSNNWTSYNINSLQELQPGDIVYYNYPQKNKDGKTSNIVHALVVHKFVDGVAYIVDCNHSGVKSYNGKCVVSATALSSHSNDLSSYNRSLARFKNIKSIPNSTVTVWRYKGNATSVTNPCQHTWDRGLCTKCKTWRKEDFQSYTEGTYYLTVKNDGTAVRTGPYEELAKKPYNKGATLMAYAKVVNARGNTWYELETNDGFKYIYSGNVTVSTNTSGTSQSNATITCSSPNTSNTGVVINPESSVVNITKGNACPIHGTIKASSGALIANVMASFDGKQYVNYNPNSSSVDIKYSDINNKLIGSTLSLGSHTLVITATDSAGNIVVSTININVSSVNQCATPTITYTDIPGGKHVTITQNTPGARLFYYYYGTGGQNASTTNNSVSFNVDRYTWVTAYSTKSGMQMSGQASKEIYVNQLAKPTITVKTVPTGAYVNLSQANNARIEYSLNGGSYQQYTQPLFLNYNCTVYARAVMNGYITSEVESKAVTMAPPAAPAVSVLTTSNKIAQGDAVSIGWNAIENASGYTVKTYKDGGMINSKNVTQNSAAIVLPEAADYYFTVSAYNAFGSSPEARTSSVTAVAPSTVRFVDIDVDGNEIAVLSEQIVKYGGSAKAPVGPERRGYDFLYWDKSYTNVTGDLTIKPVYKIKSYKVTFLNHDGNRIGKIQTVTFDNSAAIPTEGEFSYPGGYAFYGWNIQASDPDSRCDLEHIDSNMTVTAIIGWEDSELPLWIDFPDANSAIRNDDSADGNYVINLTLNSTPSQYTTAMVRVSLKTAEGKMVKTEMHTVALPAGSVSIPMTFTLKYNGTATVAEAVAIGYVGNDKTGSAYSPVATTNVTVISDYAYGAWSDWSTSATSSQSNREIGTKTQYRYRDKYTTTSGNSTMSGWTLYDTKSAWSVGGWSSFSDTVYYPTTTSTYKREVNTQSKYVKTQYQYSHYILSNGNTSPIWYSGASGLHYCGEYAGQTWLDYQIQDTGNTSNANGTKIYFGYCPTCGKNRNFYNETRQDVYKTQYQYRDSYLVYTYYFYKWGDWSAWQDTSVSATSNRQVETRTLYRYRDKNVPQYSNIEGNEDTSGEFYTFSGQLSAEEGMNLQGKKAAIMVYKGKNSDPNESQLQYVGQTIIGEGNTYDFTFKTKEEPSIITGDFIVSLSVQGATGLVNVGIIEAPDEEYYVTFYDKDGNALPVYDEEGDKVTEDIYENEELVRSETQVIKEGNSAILPEAPYVEGYTFAGWGGNTYNIMDNEDFIAQYEEKTYALVFVDWVNETVNVIESKLSDAYDEPVVEAPAGYTFNGWQADEESSTENVKVFIAQYDVESYEVNFMNYDSSEVISSMTVEYGGVAEPPETPAVSGMTFVGWDTSSEWWNVTREMYVRPVYIYNETAAMPDCSVDVNYISEDSVEEEQVISLSADEGSTIYYTLDGSDPDYESEVYTEPLVITTACTLRAVSVADNKNDSEILEIELEPNEESYGEYYHDLIEIGAVDVNANSENNEDMILQVQLTDDIELSEYLVIVECDRSVFYLDYDEETGLVYNLGNGVGYCEPWGDSGWQIHWYGYEATSGTGVLFELPMKAYVEAEPEEGGTMEHINGTYTVTASVSPSDTITDPEEEHVEDYFSINMLYEQSGDNTVTLTDCTNGAATVDGIVSGTSYSGDVSFTVSCANACLVLVTDDGGETYSKLTAVAEEDAYRFNITADKEVEIVIAKKGDANLDGKINTTDVTQTKRFIAGKRTYNAIQTLTSDINGDGKINTTDVTQTKRFIAGKRTFSW